MIKIGGIHIQRFIFLVFVPGFLLMASLSFAETVSMQEDRENAIYKTFRDKRMSEDLAMTETLKEAEKVEAPGPERLLPFIFSKTHLYGTIDTTYNDNIFAISQRTGDIIYTEAPGVKFYLGQGGPLLNKQGNKLEVDMGVEFRQYLEHPNLNRQNPFASLLAELGSDKHKLKISDYFKVNSSPASSIAQGASGMLNYTTNLSALAFENAYEHLGWDLEYDRSTYVYEGDSRSGSSYFVDKLSLTGFAIPRPLPKTHFLVEAEGSKGNYFKFGSNDRNFEDYRLWVGAQGKLAPKTTGLIKFAYERRNLNNQKDRNIFAVNLNVDYAYSTLSMFRFIAEHGAQAPTYNDQGVDIASNLTLMYNHTLTFNRKLSFFLSGGYTIDDYSGAITVPEKDKTSIFSTGLQYAFRKWLTAHLAYSFTKRDSTNPAVKYYNNIVSLNLEALF